MIVFKKWLFNMLGIKTSHDIIRESLEPYKKQVLMLQRECHELWGGYPPLMVVYEQIALRIKEGTFIIEDSSERQRIELLVYTTFLDMQKKNDGSYMHIF